MFTGRYKLTGEEGDSLDSRRVEVLGFHVGEFLGGVVGISTSEAGGEPMKVMTIDVRPNVPHLIAKLIRIQDGRLASTDVEGIRWRSRILPDVVSVPVLFLGDELGQDHE